MIITSKSTGSLLVKATALPAIAHPAVPVSPSVPTASPWALFRSKLERVGIIDAQGVVDDQLATLFPLPDFTEEEIGTLTTFFSTKAEMSVLVVGKKGNDSSKNGAKTISFSFQELLKYLHERAPKSTPLAYTEFLGGGVPWILHAYYMRSLEQLYRQVCQERGIPLEEPIIPFGIHEELQRKANDVDFRTHIDSQIDDNIALEDLNELMVTFLAEKIKETDPEWYKSQGEAQVLRAIRDNTFKNMMVIFSRCKSALVTLARSDIELDHIFTKDTYVTELFLQHGLRLTYHPNTGHVERSAGLYKGGWQAVVDKTCKMLHTLHASELNEHGWPALIYYLSHGYTEEGQFHERLYKSFDQKKKAPHIALKEVLDKHDGAIHTFIAMTYNATVKLQEIGKAPPAELHKLWFETMTTCVARVSQNPSPSHTVAEFLFAPTVHNTFLSGDSVFLSKVMREAALRLLVKRDKTESTLGYFLLAKSYALHRDAESFVELMRHLPAMLRDQTDKKSRHAIIAGIKGMISFTDEVWGQLEEAESFRIDRIVAKALVESKNEAHAKVGWEIWDKVPATQRGEGDLELVEAYLYSPYAVNRFLTLQNTRQKTLKPEDEARLFRALVVAYASGLATSLQNLEKACNQMIKGKAAAVTTEAASQFIDTLISQGAYTAAECMLTSLCRARPSEVTVRFGKWMEVCNRIRETDGAEKARKCWVEAQNIPGWKKALSTTFKVNIDAALTLGEAFYKQENCCSIADEIRVVALEQCGSDSRLLTLLSQSIRNILEQKRPAKQAIALIKKVLECNGVTSAHLQNNIERLIQQSGEQKEVLELALHPHVLVLFAGSPDPLLQYFFGIMQSQPSQDVLGAIWEIVSRNLTILPPDTLSQAIRVLDSFLSRPQERFSGRLKDAVLVSQKAVIALLREHNKVSDALLFLKAIATHRQLGEDSWDDVFWLAQLTTTSPSAPSSELDKMEVILEATWKGTYPHLFHGPAMNVARCLLYLNQPERALRWIQKVSVSSTELNSVIHECSAKFQQQGDLKRACDALALLDDTLEQDLPALERRWEYLLDVLRLTDPPASLAFLQAKGALLSSLSIEKILEKALERSVKSHSQLKLILDLIENYRCMSGTIWLRFLTTVDGDDDLPLKQQAFDLFSRHSKVMPHSVEKAKCWVLALNPIRQFSPLSIIQLLGGFDHFLAQFDGEEVAPYRMQAILQALRGGLSLIERRETPPAMCKLRFWESLVGSLKRIEPQLLSDTKGAFLYRFPAECSLYFVEALRVAIRSGDDDLMISAFNVLGAYVEHEPEYKAPVEFVDVIMELSDFALSSTGAFGGVMVNLAFPELLKLLISAGEVSHRAAESLQTAVPSFKGQAVLRFLQHVASYAKEVDPSLNDVASLKSAEETLLKAVSLFYIHFELFKSDPISFQKAISAHLECVVSLSQISYPGHSHHIDWTLYLLNSEHRLLDTTVEESERMTSALFPRMYEAVQDKEFFCPMIEELFLKCCQAKAVEPSVRYGFLFNAVQAFGILLQHYKAGIQTEDRREWLHRKLKGLIFAAPPIHHTHRVMYYNLLTFIMQIFKDVNGITDAELGLYSRYCLLAQDKQLIIDPNIVNNYYVDETIMFWACTKLQTSPEMAIRLMKHSQRVLDVVNAVSYTAFKTIIISAIDSIMMLETGEYGLEKPLILFVEDLICSFTPKFLGKVDGKATLEWRLAVAECVSYYMTSLEYIKNRSDSTYEDLRVDFPNFDIDKAIANATARFEKL